MINKNNKRAGYVWYSVIIAFTVFGYTSYQFTQLISFIFFSTKNIEDLKAVIVGTGASQIHPDYDVKNNIVQDDLLTITWNYNKREPRFFSKYTQDLDDSNWKLSDAMLASAANLLYFHPFVKKIGDEENLYISGDNFAKSPAMYAFMTAHEKNKDVPKEVKDIRVVSIGSIEALPDKISKE